MRLRNHVAIVTGAARGIGRAVADRFAAEGARVVLADVETEAGEHAAAAIRERGGEAVFQETDVGDQARVNALIDRAVAVYGRLDCAVANAAIVAKADFLDMEADDFDRVIRTNLRGAFLTGQAAAKQMVRQGEGGTIVNMSSINAVVAIPEIAPYVASKGGINQLTKVEALALAKHGIRANAIGPGSIGTDMVKQVASDPGKWQAVMSRTPMGRLGEPDEIAQIAAFLASRESGYINGECIYADGGRLALNYTVPVES